MKDEIKKSNPAAEKAFAFALRIVKLFQHLSDKKKEFVLSRQVLRSYWLRLLRASKYITEKQFESIQADCEELIRILGSTQLTMRKNWRKETGHDFYFIFHLSSFIFEA